MMKFNKIIFSFSLSFLCSLCPSSGASPLYEKIIRVACETAQKEGYVFDGKCEDEMRIVDEDQYEWQLSGMLANLDCSLYVYIDKETLAIGQIFSRCADPASINTDKIEAHYENGVLNVAFEYS